MQSLRCIGMWAWAALHAFGGHTLLIALPLCVLSVCLQTCFRTPSAAPGTEHSPGLRRLQAECSDDQWLLSPLEPVGWPGRPHHSGTTGRFWKHAEEPWFVGGRTRASDDEIWGSKRLLLSVAIPLQLSIYSCASEKNVIFRPKKNISSPGYNEIPQKLSVNRSHVPCPYAWQHFPCFKGKLHWKTSYIAPCLIRPRMSCPLLTDYLRHQINKSCVAALTYPDSHWPVYGVSSLLEWRIAI